MLGIQHEPMPANCIGMRLLHTAYLLHWPERGYPIEVQLILSVVLQFEHGFSNCMTYVTCVQVDAAAARFRENVVNIAESDMTSQAYWLSATLALGAFLKVSLASFSQFVSCLCTCTGCVAAWCIALLPVHVAHQLLCKHHRLSFPSSVAVGTVLSVKATCCGCMLYVVAACCTWRGQTPVAKACSRPS